MSGEQRVTDERLFPLQTSRAAPLGPRHIPWSVAEKAYGAYRLKYGSRQSLERLAQRGGFGWCEMDDLYPAWRDETSEIMQLRTAHRATEAKLRDALAEGE